MSPVIFQTSHNCQFSLSARHLQGELQKRIDFQAAIMDFKVTEVQNGCIIVVPSGTIPDIMIHLLYNFAYNSHF